MTVNRYQPSSPRVAFGIAAVAMTAITIAVSVVVPARMDSDSQEPRVLAALKVTAPAPAVVVTGSESIDAIALHESGMPTIPCTSSKPVRTPEG
jgi:hypothetical protein